MYILNFVLIIVFIKTIQGYHKNNAVQKVTKEVKKENKKPPSRNKYFKC